MSNLTKKNTISKPKNYQLDLLKKQKSSHGGVLKNSHRTSRPLAVKSTMHFVLKSSKAHGKWSFKKFDSLITQTISQFAQKHHIEVISIANVGNHIHLHVRLFYRQSYQKFIRAITAAIMIKVTGYSRWKAKPLNFKFWDYRPFSRVVQTFREFLNIKDYIQINRWEGTGVGREHARYLVKQGKVLVHGFG